MAVSTIADLIVSSASPFNIVAEVKIPYVAYVAKRGYRAFDTKHLKEGAWHDSLDSFINFFIERLGGQTFTEVPTGRGRTDILIIYHDKKYVNEAPLVFL